MAVRSLKVMTRVPSLYTKESRDFMQKVYDVDIIADDRDNPHKKDFYIHTNHSHNI